MFATSRRNGIPLLALSIGVSLLHACGDEGGDDSRGTGGSTTTGGQISAPTGGTSTGGSTASGGPSKGGTTGGNAPSGGTTTASGGAVSPSGGAAPTTGGTNPVTGGAAGTTGGSSVNGGGGSTGGTTAGGGSATGGTSGGSGGGWKCPDGITGKPTLSGKATRIAGLPPADDFNMKNGTFGIVEGPVWIGDALYVSEMNHMGYAGAGDNVRMSRMLKVSASDQVSIFLADSGSNGLAVDGEGNLLAAVHKDGSITRRSMPAGMPATVVAGMYMGQRFNSPNDLALRSDGNIYFSDPTFQAPSTPPQSATRVYRVAPDGTVSALSDNFNNPNGVALSLDENTLYVAANPGRRYPVMADGSLGAGVDFPATTRGDGMAVDCAGNIYMAVSDQAVVSVFDPEGTSLGSIMVSDVQAVTNVAFGGADQKTLYITGMGNNKGLFKIQLDIPGRPY